jgi:hypothetical protein
MEKHKHYQAIRAFADGWEIYSENISEVIKYPCWYEDYEYYIVPDKDGWLPWYGGECSVDNASIVEVVMYDGSTGIAKASDFYWLDKDIIKYRVIKEKPKTNKWQFIYKSNTIIESLTPQFFSSKEEAEDFTGKEVIQRADWTKVSL